MNELFLTNINPGSDTFGYVMQFISLLYIKNSIYNAYNDIIFRKLKYLDENKVNYGIFYKNHKIYMHSIDVYIVFDDVSDMMMYKLQDF